ncbi:hypothetical protein [Methanobrevibacter sp.]|uniref:hypothetical protein n=1 Tax=Methanobrevibacter sp. TaxID=66852 RepID=UPI003870ED65
MLSIFILLIVVQASFAQNNDTSTEIITDSQDDDAIYVSPEGNDENMGTYSNPVKTINKSIELASKGETNKIIINEGSYQESNLNINSKIDITAQGNVILDANKKSRIFNIKTTDEVKISGIQFQNGRDTEGGAILIKDAKVTINNCTFINNTAVEGGAIFWNADNGVLTESIFTQNRARTASAISWGGLEENAYEKGGKNGLIISCVFDNNDNANTNANCMGLALYSNNITVINSNFTNNKGHYASTGGSLHIYGDYITVDGCLFENNTMSQAPAIQSDGDFSRITNCIFKNNIINETESARAGAIEIDSINSQIINNTFINNGGEECYNGGAIAVIYDGFYGDEVIDISNNKFINNSAVYGGSIFIEGGYETYCIFKEMIVANNIFDSDIASTTAGVYVRNVDLEQCIVIIENNTFKNLVSNYASSIFIDYAGVKLKNNTITNCTSSDGNNHIYNLEGYISGNLTVTVNNNDTVELLAGKTIDVNATVMDDMNNSISGGIIRFIVQGSDVDEDGFSLETGTATVNFKSSVVGMFLVSADYTNGDLAFVKTSIVIALPYDIAILFENQTELCGQNITVPVVVAVNMYLLDGENITVSFNNETFDVLVVNGTANIDLSLPEVNGTYNLTITYDIQSETQKIVVKDNKVKLEVPDITVTPNTGKLDISLKDSENNPLAGHEINIKFDKFDKTLQTDDNGFISIDLDLGVGTYDVEVAYIGDKYKSQNKTSKITVKYLDVIITSANVTMDYNDGTSFVVRLTDGRLNPLANQIVNITLDKVYSLNTDANGIVSILLTQDPGNYSALVTYGGNNIYSASTMQNSVTIKSKAKLTASNINMYYSDSKTYKVRVYGYDGEVVGKGVKVKITVNKKTYTRTTDKNGYASFKISETPGTYTIKSSCYNITKSNKIVVKKVLTAKNISKKKSKTIKFTAKLSKGSKLLSNKKVKFKINEKTYTAKTNKKGIATVSLKNLKIGKHTIYTYYSKSSIKNIITIKK